VDIPAEEYDEIATCYSIMYYVPQKYLPMLLETCLTPKEVLCKIVLESTSSQQGKSDSLKPLIDWFRVVVTWTEEAEMSLSSVQWHEPEYTRGCAYGTTAVTR
jgi:hypothetical protein